MQTVSAKLPDTPQLQNPWNTGPNWLEPWNTLQIFMLILTLFNYCFLSWNTKKNLERKICRKKKIKLHHETVLLNIFSLKLNLCVWSTDYLPIRAFKIPIHIHSKSQDVRKCWKAALFYSYDVLCDKTKNYNFPSI